MDNGEPKPPAATAISRRLAPGGGGGGAWIGGPKTASSEKFGIVKDWKKDTSYVADLFGQEVRKEGAVGKIREVFDIPPFTVLNAREGPWQDRKAQWIKGLGMESEVGRGTNLLKMSDTLLEPDPEKRAAIKKARLATDNEEPQSDERYRSEDGWVATGLTFASGTPRRDEVSLKLQETSTGTSIFDPVLTELCYKWFCPPGGLIVDPFAGGSVRGLVAGLLGYRYHGIDLRPEQIEANEQQKAEIAPDADIVWRAGDSNVLLKDAPEADFIFSCPPYGDLEHYSDDPADISNMTWEGFVGIYRAIIRKSVEKLKPNRFACFVVGEYRDSKTGLYRGFVPLTCASFMACGAALYNEAILVTAVGSLPIRVENQFLGSRKLGKTHQNILVFCKGDPKKAAEALNQTAQAPVRHEEPSAERSGLKLEARPALPHSPPLPPPALPPRAAPLDELPFPSAPISRGTLAEFIIPRAEPDWTPDEPPSLDGIDSLVLNFSTDGLEWSKGARPIGVTVASLDGQMVRFLPFKFAGRNLDEEVVKRWMREQVRGKHIINSKTKFDIHQAREWGVDLIEQGNTFSDIQHTAALLDDHRKRFSLDILVEDYLKTPPMPRQDESRHQTYAAYEVAEREKYTVQSVVRLRELFYPMLEEQELQKVQALEDGVIPVVVEMEKNGSPIDMELLEQYQQECTAEYGRLMREVIDEAGFGFDHTASAWSRLFEQCGLTPSDSYAEHVVGVVDHPLIKKAFYAGQISSLNSKTFAAYQKQVDSQGILRYDINQLLGDEGGTVSGRFSIGYVQQVPNKDNHSAVFGDLWFPRRLYKAQIGQYLEADAAQIEYRIFAHYANNAAVIKAYQEDPNLSFHKMTWEMVKAYKADMLYSHQKNLNFAKLYGAKTVKLGVMMGFITKAEGDEIRSEKRWDDPRLTKAQEIDRMYSKAIPEVNLLLDRASHLAKLKCDNFCKTGDSLHREYPHRGFVKTLLGRRSRFPNNYKTYRGLNRVIQGSAADIMKQKLIELFKVRKEIGLTMRLTVHDAVTGDAQEPSTLEKVKEILNHQSIPELKVPILWECGVGPNWAETKK